MTKGIEHIGLVVKDSREMADWYHRALGFTILKSAETETGHVAFIQCSSTGLIFELITDKTLPPIEDALSHPLQLHIAFTSSDIEADKNRLLELGAKFETDCATADPEATVLIIRDPWGNYIQLAKRKEDFYR